MLAAYNAGPGRTDAYATGRRGLPAETLAYVRQIAPELGASDGPSSVPAPELAAPGWRDASLFAAPPHVTDTADTPTVAAPTLRRSEKRRVGRGCGSTRRFRGWPFS